MKWGKDYKLTWQRWFAWHPKRIGTQWVWLQTIEAYYNPHHDVWIYREIQK